MRPFCLIFLLNFFSFFLYGQQFKIDSLITQLELEKTNEGKIKILEPLSKILINSSNPDKSLPYFLEMSRISKALKKKKLESRAYKYIAECYMQKGDFNNAVNYSLKALKISEDYDDTNFYLIDINQLGRVYHHFQKYDQAIETYNKGIAKYKSAPKGNAICTIYLNLGSAYGQKGEKDKEIHSFLEGSKYADKLADYTAKSFALYNIAYLYMGLNQYEKSEKYYLMALKDSSKIDNKAYIYMNHHGLGNNYSRWGKYKKALKHDQISYNYYKSIGNKLYQFDVLNNTAVTYSRMDNSSKSVEYADLALKLATELDHKLAIAGAKQTLANGFIGLKKYNKAENILLEIAKDTTYTNIISLETKATIYQNLYLVYEGKKNYIKALEYFEKHKNTNDSILINQRDSKFSEVETKYQTERKEKENLQLKAEKSEQAKLLALEGKRKWQLGGGLVIALLGLGVFTFYYCRNQKQKSVIEHLQKELHHRVKNNLAIIDTFIEVVKDDFNDKIIDAKLTELQNRIESINEVHKQLYSSKDVTNLNLKKYINTLAKNVHQSFNVESISIQQSIDENIKISPEKSFPMGLIINEFITNSYKYAFDDASGIITIQLDAIDNKICLLLSDNGKGLSDGFSIVDASTFGIRIMKLLTEQLKGSFNLTNDNGVKLTIEFPK